MMSKMAQTIGVDNVLLMYTQVWPMQSILGARKGLHKNRKITNCCFVC